MYVFTQNQQGNVLWFILIAIALFGLLTAVLNRNTSSVNQAGNTEKARIKAASLLRYSKSVEAAVQRMTLNGTSENDLDFVAIDASHDNPNCTSTECEVFHVEGGGIEFKSPSDIVSDPSYTGNWLVSTQNLVYQQGCDTVDSTCTELLLLAEDVPRAVCLQVNAIQKTINPGSDAPQIEEVLDDEAYAGTFSTTLNARLFGGTDAVNEAPEVKGKPAGCVFEFGSSQNKYYFYQILITR